MRASVGLISLLLFSAALAHAQSYSIDWFTIDGGGGTSTGRVFSVSGTIGQPDASGAELKQRLEKLEQLMNQKNGSAK